MEIWGRLHLNDSNFHNCFLAARLRELLKLQIAGGLELRISNCGFRILFYEQARNDLSRTAKGQNSQSAIRNPQFQVSTSFHAI
jgi:hypothetical protein